ncbi:MAG: GNAT family N-acetyltransferase [Alphaproteobacteria bacterium]
MIVTLASRADATALWAQIEEIFFLSSPAQRFASEVEKQAFLERWTGYYRESERERIYLSLDATGRVAGYLTGCGDSTAARRLYRDIESYHLFEHLFDAYPAHFHVNCHPNFRRRGVGTALVEAFVAACVKDGVAGVHIVTGTGADNVAFYRECGLEFAVARRWRGKELLFMGRRLRAPWPSAVTPR